ncbi:BT_3987 domain-containing protein [Flavobacterium sp. 5]|uniref:BT_3987 domain-containing protein n=1 Tax=Flavobacterium sp. 5 TaxID=2035199 RepID=UPI000C2CABD2|nr:DUF1735 domain-containing protein [Flavobacterium sp. 5]PKB18985.1 uncharacterized protein DUF1735 [Flavobacterium sp. 5]
MNKLILYTYLLLGCLFVSCNDSIDETVNERTSFNLDLYFETYGFQKAEMSTTEDEFSYILKIKNKDAAPLDVTLKVDEQILNDYNSVQKTDYKILPASYYTLTESLKLNAIETSTPIVFNIQKIVDELGLEASANYVVPIKLQSNTADSNNDSIGSQAIVHVAIADPTLFFDDKVVKLVVDDTVAKPILKVYAKYNFNNIDVSKFTVQANPDKVATYNAANNTNYLSFPAGSYSFKSIEVDKSKHQLTISYELDSKLLDTEGINSYLLPLDFVSAEYIIQPDTTINLDVSFKSTKPVYEGVFDLTTNQPPTNDYFGYQVTIDLSQAAKLLKTTEDELKIRSNIVFYAINNDDRTFMKDYTANPPGFWFSKNGNAEGYNDNSLMYVEYDNDGILNIGQFPDATVSGDKYTVSMALVYNGLMVRYNIHLNIN